MKKFSKKGFALYLSVAFFFLFFSLGNSVHADIIQGNQGTSATSTNGGTFFSRAIQTLGTGITGTLTSFEVSYFSQNWINKSWAIEECTDSTYSTCVAISSGYFVDGVHDGVETVSGLNVNFSSNNWYRLNFYLTNLWSTFYGSNANPYSAGRAYFDIGSDTPNFDIYFKLYGVTETLNRIISYEPINNFTTASTTVTFTATVYISSTGATSTVNWDMWNYDQADHRTLSFEVYPVGTTTVSTTTVMTTGFWASTIDLRQNNGSLYDSIPTGFTVISSASGRTGFEVSTSTTVDQNNFLSFLNVPNLIRTKVPFAYMIQMAQIINNSIASTSTSTIPSGTFSWSLPITANASTTYQIDMFSTSTIGYFLTPSQISIIRGIMAAVVWISLGMYLFHDARDKRHLI